MKTTRRHALRLALGAFATAAITPRLGLSAPAPPAKTANALIVLYMAGGASQIDTFDPKPGRETGGEFRSIRTAVPGVHFAEHLRGLAQRADQLTVLRSLTYREGNHDRARYLVHTGYPPQGSTAHPAFGSLVGDALGDGPLPPYVSIAGPGQSAGFLGAAASPLVIRDPRRSVRNVRPAPPLSDADVDDRIALWRTLQDNFDRDRDSRVVHGHDEVVEQALEMSRAAELAALDLERVPSSIRGRYGEGTFGQGCLMAHRLVESGVRVVEVTLEGWDTHTDNFSKVARLSGELDQAMSALLDDLRASGLLDETIVLWIGDFGRTPRINARGGRDHYPQVSSAVLAGGPFARGKVVGATNDDGYEITESAVGVPDLFRTLATALGIDPDGVRMSPQGRPIYAVDGGQIVTDLLA